MEERISFERFLFGDGKSIVINDIEFFIDRIFVLPKFQPHKLEKAVSLSVEYCQNPDFRRKFLEKSNECPVLIYQLFKRGIFEFENIEPFLHSRDTFILCCYFRKEINNFGNFVRSKQIPYDFDESLLGNSNDIDQLVEYGFINSSLEYCLKYDVIDDLPKFDNLNHEAKWSPFEWSLRPQYLNLLSFAGYFGSIKCFKQLLLKGFEINKKVMSMVVCGGCFDLFHLCRGSTQFSIDNVCRAAEFCQLSLLVFMKENGTDIIAKAKYEFNLFLMRLLFILLLGRVILVLLNI